MLKDAVDAVRALVRPVTLFVLLGAVIYFLGVEKVDAAMVLSPILGGVIIWYFKVRDEEHRKNGG